MGPEGVGASRVRAVDRGTVEKRRDLVDLLPNPVIHLIDRAIKIDLLRARRIRTRIKIGIAGGNGNRHRFRGRRPLGEVDVVIDELPKQPEHVRQIAALGWDASAVSITSLISRALSRPAPAGMLEPSA